MSTLPKLCSSKNSRLISRDIWFGWLDGGSRCRAQGLRTETGLWRRPFVTKAREDDGHEPKRTSPSRDTPDMRGAARPRPSSSEATRTRSIGWAYGPPPSPAKNPPKTRTTDPRRPQSRETIRVPFPSSAKTIRNPSKMRTTSTVRPPGRLGVAETLLLPSSEKYAAQREELLNPVRGDAPRYIIKTLNPARMVELGQQLYDISGQDYIYLRHYPLPMILPYSAWSISNSVNTGTVNPAKFPPRTQGVLYYHSPPPGRPEVSGSLRFRICGSIAEFDQGRDLQLAFGRPWGPPLYRLVRAPPAHWGVVVGLLIRDGCVDPALVDDLRRACQDMYVPRMVETAVDTRMLYTVSDSFDIDLKGPTYKAHLVTRHRVEIIDIQAAFRDRFGVKPYIGHIRVRFEFNTLRRPDAAPSLVIRVLEILSPISCVVPDYRGTVVRPLKGCLIERRKGLKFNQYGANSYFKPFTIDLEPGAPNAPEFVRAFFPRRTSQRELVDELVDGRANAQLDQQVDDDPNAYSIFDKLVNNKSFDE